MGFSKQRILKLAYLASVPRVVASLLAQVLKCRSLPWPSTGALDDVGDDIVVADGNFDRMSTGTGAFVGKMTSLAEVVYTLV